MSVAENQARTFLDLLGSLRGQIRTDPRLPRKIHTLLASNRTFGSRDRRLYRELIYTTLRYLPWIEPCVKSDPAEAVRRVAWLAAEIPATAAFRAAFATGPRPEGDLAELLPSWFRAHCPEIFTDDERAAQLRRAPLWIRIQTDDAKSVTDEFDQAGWKWRRSPILPSALEVMGDVDLTTTRAFEAGAFEIQDLGSQLILESVGVGVGETWFDACAGAGGKSLQLAGLVGPTGHVAAADIRDSALEELAKRAARAGRKNIGVGAPASAGVFDGVLVDAPCSGSGTWRRSPHLKWQTTPALIEKRAALQRTLIARYAQCVRRGGRLVYATCSLSPHENEQIVDAFLAAHEDFQPEPFAQTFGAAPRGKAGLLILPALHDTDGFFVASLRRR